MQLNKVKIALLLLTPLLGVHHLSNASVPPGGTSDIDSQSLMKSNTDLSGNIANTTNAIASNSSSISSNTTNNSNATNSTLGLASTKSDHDRRITNLENAPPPTGSWYFHSNGSGLIYGCTSSFQPSPANCTIGSMGTGGTQNGQSSGYPVCKRTNYVCR